MRLSIVIVNYNVRYFLEQCLRSVEVAIEGIDAEVWVVDNHSVDGSVSMVQDKFPWVRLIANDKNLGFSKANNQALRLAAGSYQLLLNPDTLVEADTFRKCMDYMDANPDCGALGVRMIDGSGHFLPESKRGLPDPWAAFYKMFGLSGLFPKSKRFGKYHLGYLSEFEIADVDVLSGAFMFIKKAALMEAGLLDEAFFMYGEDIDLSYRIQKSGFRNVYFPETTIIHYKGESTKKFSVNYVRVFYQAMIIFARKHYASGRAGVLIFLIRMAVFFRAGVALLRRWFEQLRLPLLDAGLMFAGLWYIKGYWEVHIKYIESYPKELTTVHVPYYITLWLGSVFMAGGYTRPISVRRITAGMFTGTVLILAVYSLFPEDLRFSRAIILLGAAWGLLSIIASRLSIHLLRYGNLRIGEMPELHTVVVGNPEERMRVYDLLQRARVHNRFIGFVGCSLEKEAPMLLGNMGQLRELIELYHIGEVIFCGADVPSEQIITQMNATADLNVQFKIVPSKSRFVIGSHSKNETGELYAEEVQLKLLMADNLRKKRLMDALIAVLLILLFPILGLLQKSAVLYLKRCFFVLSGKLSWVGFGSEKPIQGSIPVGVIEPWKAYRIEDANEELKAHFNYLYARDYDIGKDLSLIMRNVFQLGS